MSICKVVNLSLSFYFSNNQSYLFEMPLREKLGDKNKTNQNKTPKSGQSLPGFGFLSTGTDITPTWQDYCEYERRQSLLQWEVSIGCLGDGRFGAALLHGVPLALRGRVGEGTSALLTLGTIFFFCYPAGKDVFYPVRVHTGDFCCSTEHLNR